MGRQGTRRRRGVAARPETQRPGKSQAGGGTRTLVPRSGAGNPAGTARRIDQVRWDEIAESIEAALPESAGGWYAPATTASLVRSYFLRHWKQRAAERKTVAAVARQNARQVRFDFFFEHYQLRDIAQPLVERQLRDLEMGLI